MKRFYEVYLHEFEGSPLYVPCVHRSVVVAHLRARSKPVHFAADASLLPRRPFLTSATPRLTARTREAAASPATMGPREEGKRLRFPSTRLQECYVPPLLATSLQRGPPLARSDALAPLPLSQDEEAVAVMHALKELSDGDQPPPPTAPPPPSPPPPSPLPPPVPNAPDDLDAQLSGAKEALAAFEKASADTHLEQQKRLTELHAAKSSANELAKAKAEAAAAAHAAAAAADAEATEAVAAANAAAAAVEVEELAIGGVRDAEQELRLQLQRSVETAEEEAAAAAADAQREAAAKAKTAAARAAAAAAAAAAATAAAAAAAAAAASAAAEEEEAALSRARAARKRPRDDDIGGNDRVGLRHQSKTKEAPLPIGGASAAGGAAGEAGSPIAPNNKKMTEALLAAGADFSKAMEPAAASAPRS